MNKDENSSIEINKLEPLGSNNNSTKIVEKNKHSEAIDISEENSEKENIERSSSKQYQVTSHEDISSEKRVRHE